MPCGRMPGTNQLFQSHSFLTAFFTEYNDVLPNTLLLREALLPRRKRQTQRTKTPLLNHKKSRVRAPGRFNAAPRNRISRHVNLRRVVSFGEELADAFHCLYRHNLRCGRSPCCSSFRRILERERSMQYMPSQNEHLAWSRSLGPDLPHLA
jgi:hypothetical protein